MIHKENLLVLHEMNEFMKINFEGIVYGCTLFDDLYLEASNWWNNFRILKNT